MMTMLLMAMLLLMMLLLMMLMLIMSVTRPTAVVSVQPRSIPPPLPFDADIYDDDDDDRNNNDCVGSARPIHPPTAMLLLHDLLAENLDINSGELL